MADEYNITELIPTSNRNEIKAILTFSGTVVCSEVSRRSFAHGIDHAMNAALLYGTTISQTIKAPWRVDIAETHVYPFSPPVFFTCELTYAQNDSGDYFLTFTLHHDGTVRPSEDQLNNTGTVTWSVSFRDLKTGALIKNACAGNVSPPCGLKTNQSGNFRNRHAARRNPL
jgi:hypothetical protein